MRCILIVFVAFSCSKNPPGAADAAAPPAVKRPVLESVGPRVVSNQTATPITVRGANLVGPLELDVGGTLVPLTVLDSTHAYARLPAGLKVSGGQLQSKLDVRLKGESRALALKLIDDVDFPVLTALAVDAKTAYVASLTEDAVYAVDLDTRAVVKRAVGDGPSALGIWKGELVVAHRFAPELRVGDRVLPAPAYAAALLIDGDTAYLAEHARDTVSALSLDDGREKWRAPVAPNPGALAITPQGLAVGSLQTGELELLEASTGKLLDTFQPGPGAEVAGPKTVAGNGPELSPYIMGGSMQRAYVYSASTRRLFAASLGPNIGPNPQKMEVSMNSGVGVLELPPKWVRHLGFAAGVTHALALDDKRGLLYAADLGVGLVRVLDVKKLSASKAAVAEKAVLQELAIPPPDDFPLVRAKEDFAVKGRAGVSLHSGPAALELSADRKTLFVLNRFTGTVARIDVSKGAKLIDQLAITPMLAQAARRRGEVLYFTDLGRTAMTCDTCHPDGHTGGVLFEKTTPMRIYRSTTVRGSLETPPYFTPASTFSIGETSEFVFNRNRFANPTPTPQESEDLALYTAAIPTLPNPFVGADGAPLEELTLPDGKPSHPRKGLALFEGKAACAGCHPGPHFTTDQDTATRGKYLDVGTPHVLPLRPELQSPIFRGFAPPALAGAWDIFPMLTTGAAGLAPEADRLVVDTRFPLRKAVADFAPKHGRSDLLTPQELDDLLGYVQSL